MTVTDVATAAGLAPGRNSGAEVLYRCPNHDDQHPSLSLNPQKNLWICGPCGKQGTPWALAAFLAGVEPDDKQAVKLWLNQHGLTTNGNGTKANGGKRIVAEYNYTDEGGKLLYQKLRYRNADGSKSFGQRRPDGKGGWINKLDNVRQVPYRLADILESNYLLWVEGEKDGDNVAAIGLKVATSGSSNSWRPEFLAYFRSEQHITILCDHDEPGRRYAQTVAAALFGRVASVKILELPGLAPGGDVSDWLQGKDRRRGRNTQRPVGECAGVEAVRFPVRTKSPQRGFKGFS
jgi:hypothetical protein